jgi:hypothetical protein
LTVNRVTGIKIAISIAAVGLIGVHAAWPSVKVDAVTLGLVIVAILPWLSAVVESAEFPGGWKIKFRDLETAARKVTKEAPVAIGLQAPPAADTTWSPDPNLALVQLRVEIEKRLRALAEQHGLQSRRPLSQLVIMLRNGGFLDRDVGSGLQELIAAGNQAAHGARVEDMAASWAAEQGPRVLASLDLLIERARQGA